MTAAVARIQYAGFWRRALALLLDSLLYTALILPLLVGIYGPGYLNWWLGDSSQLASYGMTDLLITYVAPFVLVIVCWRRWQATPGKLLLDCRVVDARTHQPLSLRQAVIRALGYILSALPFYLGFVWAAIDKRKQALHDKLAGSVVIQVIDDDSDINVAQWRERLGL
ncbi:RDD family protein [Thiohalophilus sp.]|uniref:RDD family protein n=1 Tax=Thiohalophilus sp. TaxID=3028392 RepID=UPI002ACD9D20|nr:RDD family protein [Thiohalophilus sp.]MDZ7803343.1 RDD family protein [Thiohalophilus sp.]